MCNVGGLDKFLRFLVGVVALVASFVVGSMVSTTAGFITGIVGVIMIGTAIFGFCPFYPLLKISTCKK